ncbi:hypothetical protein [uncultured Formosa sp.]|uniref:hypothetical protein n=1 Tax=uncultured Formosa sp. TaxID=255435 RepID=UPI00263866A0|nr:hypothetical protein [uncultured Formosa sp.]
MKKGLRTITLSYYLLLSLIVFTAYYRDYFSDYGLKTNAGIVLKMVSNTNNTPWEKNNKSESNTITIYNISLSTKIDKDDTILCKIDSSIKYFPIKLPDYKINYFFNSCNTKHVNASISRFKQQTESQITHTYKIKATEHFKNILIKDFTNTENDLVLSTNANNALNTIVYSNTINSRITLDIYYS